MVEVIGLVGMVMILTAFLLDLFEVLHSSNKFYILLNLVGSLFLAYYAYLLSSLPFFVLNSVWAGAALVELVVVLKKRRKK